jgi:hypothetical protein
MMIDLRLETECSEGASWSPRLHPPDQHHIVTAAIAIALAIAIAMSTAAIAAIAATPLS